MVQLSHPYMTTGKTIVLTIQTFVSRVVSLLLYLVHCLSRFVTAYLPRNKCFNFMVSVTVHSDLGAQENKISHYFYCFSFCLL